MLSSDRYRTIENKYGHYASWALWAEAAEKPKSNIGDIRMFNIATNPNIVNELNPHIILCGLNISRRVEKVFGNFHDDRPQSQDYKIRYALKGSKISGAYMTDIIKDFEQVVSGNVVSFLKHNEDFEKKNIEIFEQELKDLGAVNPLVIAFGNDSYNILQRNFKEKYQIIKLPHYSMQISKENYKALIDSHIA